eukprot:sb/3475124/
MVSGALEQLQEQLVTLRDRTCDAADLRLLLLQKEKELEIAARIGQSLLKKVGTLEGDLHSAQSSCEAMEHRLNQLNYEVSCKDEQLKFVNGEMEDRREDETVEMKNALLIMNKECQELKMENSHLKEQVR